MKLKNNFILAFSGPIIMFGALATVLLTTTAKSLSQDKPGQLVNGALEAACNMPREYAQSLTTEELVDYALNYPFLMDLIAFDHMEDGMNHLAKKSSLFAELFSRSDCCEELLAQYLNMDINDTTFDDS